MVGDHDAAFVALDCLVQALGDPLEFYAEVVVDARADGFFRLEEGEYTAEQLAAGFMKLKMGADIQDLVLFEKRETKRDRYRRTGERLKRRDDEGKGKGQRTGYKRDKDDKKPYSKKSADRKPYDRKTSEKKSKPADKPMDKKPSRKPRKSETNPFENVGRVTIKGESSTKAWYMGQDGDSNTMNMSREDKKKVKAQNKKRSLDYLQDVSDLVMESFGKRKNREKK